LGHTGVNDPRRLRFNVGPGVEAALETTVRDAFVQEFNASKLAHGWIVKKSKPRFWVIEREVPFLIRDEHVPCRVDVVFRRIDAKRPSAFTYPIGPIELKRARHFTPNLATGRPRKGGSNLPAVRADIQNLARLVRAARAGSLVSPNLSKLIPPAGEDKVHPHILIWGKRRGVGGSHESMPRTYVEQAFNGIADVYLHELHVEWCPISWKRAPQGQRDPPTVTAWLWVAYAELKVR